MPGSLSPPFPMPKWPGRRLRQALTSVGSDCDVVLQRRVDRLSHHYTSNQCWQTHDEHREWCFRADQGTAPSQNPIYRALANVVGEASGGHQGAVERGVGHSIPLRHSLASALLMLTLDAGNRARGLADAINICVIEEPLTSRDRKESQGRGCPTLRSL